MLDHDVVSFTEICHRHRHEDLIAQQFREHWGTLRTEVVISETTQALIDPPLDGGHKTEGAGIFQVVVQDLATTMPIVHECFPAQVQS